MNIVCVICSDLLTPSDDVFYTPCGHIFHFACVTQWLERSKTCPQCRDKVTQSKIHRIYFNFSNNDTILEDATSLQSMVDSLKFKIMVKDGEIKQALAKNDSYKKEASGLRAEVRKLENDLVHKETAISSQKEQIRFFRDQSIEAENAKKEVARLKKKLHEFRSVQLLINAPSEDVDEMITSTHDPATLMTYISVMKRELATSVARRKELRNSVKKLQLELTKVSMERNFLSDEHEKRKLFEEMLTIAESEKYALENRLRELENGTSTSKPKNFADRKTDTNESTNESRVDVDGKMSAVEMSRLHKKSSDIIDLCDDSPLMRKNRPPQKVDETISLSDENIRGNEENSPLGGYKYNISGELSKSKKKLATGTSAYSILAKKPRLAQTHAAKRPSSDMTYDGFGGHSKEDKFPSPKKFNREVKKQGRQSMKKSKLDDGNNKSLGDFVNFD